MTAQHHATVDRPLVSVVIPAYNAMPYLPIAVNSALAQTYQPVEVVVVDDGSSDDTAEWVRGATDDRVVLVSKPNGGASSARNHGVRAARGKYVAFLDSDDYWEPNKIALQVDRAESSPKPMLVDTWAYCVDARGHKVADPKGHHHEGDVWPLMVQLGLVTCGSSTLLVPRTCFDVVGLFREDLHHAEDWEMWIRLTRRYPLAVVKQGLSAYRQHENGKHRNYDNLLPAMLRVVDIALPNEGVESRRLRRIARANVYLHVASRVRCSPGAGRKAMSFVGRAVAHRPRLLVTRRCALVVASGVRDVARLSAISHAATDPASPGRPP
jgi:glycosyltransferase involved in cell wall biosynthesis